MLSLGSGLVWFRWCSVSVAVWVHGFRVHGFRVSGFQGFRGGVKVVSRRPPLVQV